MHVKIKNPCKSLTYKGLINFAVRTGLRKAVRNSLVFFNLRWRVGLLENVLEKMEGRPFLSSQLSLFDHLPVAAL